jgi:hypothetical protein
MSALLVAMLPRLRAKVRPILGPQEAWTRRNVTSGVAQGPTDVRGDGNGRQRVNGQWSMPADAWLERPQ